ncbi:response regulator [candidate division KSB1 bacterium]
MDPRLLIVDDEPHIRNLIKTALTEKDTVIDIAGDYNSAIELLEKEIYSVVLTDKNYPGISHDLEGGLDLMRHIKERYPTTEVILMTGYASTESAIEAIRLGAFDYIEKPFKIDDIKNKIGRVLEYQRSVSPDILLSKLNDFKDDLTAKIDQIDSLDDDNKTNLAIAFSEHYDYISSVLRTRERVIFLQHEALQEIEKLARDLQAKTPDSHPFYDIIEQILYESGKRL